MNEIRILVVDDEQTLCEILKLNLNMEGFSVEIANSAEEAMRKNLKQYQLILLDVMMGGMNGYDFITWLHNQPELSKIPVILCTAKSEESERIEGLLRGADDYICKPFSMKELVLRVKNILRRIDVSVLNYKITVDSIIMDLKDRSCLIDNMPIELTKKEFDLLYVLLFNIDKILSREEILSQVWNDDVCVIDRSVDVTINRVRKKIGKYSECIITKHGYGYGFKLSKSN